jgi:hypothetical protein
MDLVDNYGPRGCEHLPPGLRAEEDVKRLRRGHDDVRRAAPHAIAFAGRRVAGPDPGADVYIRQPLRPQIGSNTCKGRLQIALDIVRQRFERGNVDDLCLVAEFPIKALPHQLVDGGQEGSERLARACRSGDQHMLSRLDG